jgi:hypothetical protein
MKRVFKEAIMAAALITSLIAMILLEQSDTASPNDSYTIAILLLIVISLICVIALITFSRTGTEGSEGDWGTAFL